MSKATTFKTLPISPLPSSEVYLQARNDLVRAERAHGVYGNSAGNSLEAEAGRIVETLKKWEERNHHGVQTDGTGSEAGHKFIYSKPFIRKSSLFAIALRAPKGALLHCHFDAMLPPEDMIRDARGRENLFIKSDVSLTSPGFFAHALPQFTVLPVDEKIEMTEASDLFSKGYVPGNCMRYSTFRKIFPGGEEAAEAWLAGKMVLGTDNAYHPKQTVDGIWREFGRNFTILRTLLGYYTAYRKHFRRVIWKFARDGISYAEIRVALNYRFSISSDDGKRQLSQEEIVQIFADTLDQEQPRIKAEGLSFFGVKIIYACMRNSTREAMTWCMDNCISLKQKFPLLICGFDMQGQEDAGHPLSHWVSEILSMRAKCTSLNLDLPFIFHAGETLDHGGDTDSNLYDAILLGTKRIGHGFSITKHPLLMQMCKERDIAIETCPISNEVLGLCATVKSHHLPTLMANGVPCSISSDDPGCWDATVLSHDFYQTLIGSNYMTLLGWRILAQWSIHYSCIKEEAREDVEKDFGDRWERFCQWIVDEFGARAADVGSR